jgi:hypothetical protein
MLDFAKDVGLQKTTEEGNVFSQCNKVLVGWFLVMLRS